MSRTSRLTSSATAMTMTTTWNTLCELPACLELTEAIRSMRSRQLWTVFIVDSHNLVHLPVSLIVSI